MGDWIYVPTWAKFQHYKDRRPTWIKLYLDLRDRDGWVELTLAERGLLVSIWLEFAAKGPLSREMVTRYVGHRVSQKALDRLNKAGYIAFAASKALALREEKNKRGLLADLEPDNPNHEPPRDPTAARRIKEMAERLGRQ